MRPSVYLGLKNAAFVLIWTCAASLGEAAELANRPEKASEYPLDHSQASEARIGELVRGKEMMQDFIRTFSRDSSAAPYEVAFGENDLVERVVFEKESDYRLDFFYLKDDAGKITGSELTWKNVDLIVHPTERTPDLVEPAPFPAIHEIKLPENAASENFQFSLTLDVDPATFDEFLASLGKQSFQSKASAPDFDCFRQEIEEFRKKADAAGAERMSEALTALHAAWKQLFGDDRPGALPGERASIGIIVSASE